MVSDLNKNFGGSTDLHTPIHPPRENEKRGGLEKQARKRDRSLSLTCQNISQNDLRSGEPPIFSQEGQRDKADVHTRYLLAKHQSRPWLITLLHLFLLACPRLFSDI